MKIPHFKPKKLDADEEFKKRFSVEVWTEQNEKVYSELRRKHDRIYAKKRRDKTRVRSFSHKAWRKVA